jgi:hypothetical protein
MARYNPDLMQLDDGDTGAPRVAGPRADTSEVTAEDVKKQLDLAAVELGLDPRGAQFEETQIFSPIGGGSPFAGASLGDAEYFSRNGFNPGSLPIKYQGLFGSDSNVIGWRLVSNPDGSKSIEVATPQGDIDGGLQFQTYGATFKEDNFGNVTTVGTNSTVGIKSATGTFGQSDVDAAYKAGQAATAASVAAKATQERESIIKVLQDRFSKYGLTGLTNKIKELAIDGATEATITLGLMATEEYKMRFKANEVRIKNNLTVLQPGEYLNLEDGYRQVLRSYGLKAFDNDEYVSQFIANDVSAAELSNRVVTAVQRVQNADPAVSKQLRDFYGIGSADLVAYVLDPQQQFQKIERQVAASEIGVAAGRQGLSVGVGVAEQLAAQGVSMAEAQKGYATIADILPTAEKLSAIYGDTTQKYNQSSAEQEVFNSLASAQRARQRLTGLEVGTFSTSSGMNRASLTDAKSAGQF